MFEKLLLFIVREAIYVEIKGVTSAGGEKFLNEFQHVPGVFQQENTIFSEDMVQNILFHSHGATIVLKH